VSLKSNSSNKISAFLVLLFLQCIDVSGALQLMEYTDLLNRAAVEKDPYVKLALAGELPRILASRSLCQALVPGSDSRV
jgi:hypothetical protein